MNRYGTRRCDLCGERLDGRAAYDAHHRDVHGVTSIKPRSILAKVTSILKAMPGGPPPCMSPEDARAKLEALDRKVAEDADRERRLREALVEDKRRYERDSVKKLCDGWLTVQCPPGAVDFPLTSAIEEVAESDRRYVYLSSGSYLQVRSEQDRARVLGYLRDYVRQSENEGVTEGLDEAREQARVVESMRPWSGSGSTHRYGG